MVEDITTVKLFYPMLFFVIGLILTFVIFNTKSILMKFKDSDNFNKSNDNIKELALDNNKVCIDTTDKFSKAHTQITTCLPQHYENELHALEIAIKNTDDKLIALAEDVNKKLDLIIEKIIRLENKN